VDLEDKIMNLLETLERYYNEGWLIKQTHPELPLTIWNYSQTTQYAGKWDDVTLMTRGLVTDNETGEVVGRPFKKFFNLEENRHTSTNEFEVYDKMDGSLGILFYYERKLTYTERYKLWFNCNYETGMEYCEEIVPNFDDPYYTPTPKTKGEWIFASRGSFTSEQAQAASKLFYKQYGAEGMRTDTTYLFEFTAPWNRIVVDYGDDEQLTLLGGIKTEDGMEASWYHLDTVSKLNGFPLVKKYDGITDYTTLKGMIGDNEEGFVIRFSNGERIKIKGEEYLRLHRIMTGVSTTSVWDVLANGGNMEEILKNVPDEFYDKIKEVVGDIAVRFDNIRTDYIQYFTDIVFKIGREDRRRFAEEARRYNHSSILFAMLDGKDINPIIWKIVKPEWRKL
jgi:RNA ligase